MTYPRINTTQLQNILSGKVQIETFSTLKNYPKSIFVSYNNGIYYSLVDISAGAFKPSQWQKVILLSDFDTKQDKITSTGSTNLLTAPEYVGGQPGKIAIDSLEPAFNILPKSKGGAGKDLTNILKSANADNILVIDSNGDIINVKSLDRSQLSEEINDLLDSADTAIQPSELNEVKVSLDNHKKDESNPHKVTKAQVGLGNVDNTSDIDKPISKATQDALDLKANQSTTYTKDETNELLDKKLDIDTASDTYATIDDFEEHTKDTSNPHSVTKEQVGLGNVDNTSDIDKPISKATQDALDLKQDNLTAGERIIINNNIIETTATRIIVRKW